MVSIIYTYTMRCGFAVVLGLLVVFYFVQANKFNRVKESDTHELCDLVLHDYIHITC